MRGSNPLRGLRAAREKNPTRVVLAEEEYLVLLKMSDRVDWRFRVALVLAHETGIRIGAIRQLPWFDIDFEGRTILWRAEHDKSGYEHTTPVTDDALAALREARNPNPETGEAPVLPAPRNPSACIRAALAGMVGQGREVGGAGAQARQGLALATAEVRLRPHRPVTSAPTKDSFGRLWKLVGDLAAEIAKRRESNGWNPTSQSRKFNVHEHMRIYDHLPGWQGATQSGAATGRNV